MNENPIGPLPDHLDFTQVRDMLQHQAQPDELMLPDKITSLPELLQLYTWLELKRARREKIIPEQQAWLEQLVPEAMQYLGSIKAHLGLCYVGACYRSGLEPNL